MKCTKCKQLKVVLINLINKIERQNIKGELPDYYKKPISPTVRFAIVEAKKVLNNETV